MTLSGFQLKVIHLLQTFSNVIFSYICVAVDKISTDVTRLAIPLREIFVLNTNNYLSLFVRKRKV